ncbi:porin [Simonsiella muelleri]|uniref:porin n=1 Tax=Simonsiella muelleri TaxID=72 RepID=UPI0028D89605|nr:porin [Simonsiella muelleri]
MKKTLIALALVSLPLAASADVVLYGQIKGGVEVSKNFTKAEKGTKKGTLTHIVDYGSRIGFKGHEDLSNNLRAIWQLEQNVSIGGEESGFSNRDSFIGLNGNFGTVKAGYIETPVKTANGRLDVWEYSDSAAGLGTYTRSNAAVKRAGAISYETPNMAGFSAQAYVSPSDNNNGDKFSFGNYNKTKDSAIYGAKVGYENSGFFADVAGTYVKNAQAGNDVNTIPAGKDGYQAVANVGYDANNWLAGVSYQQGRYVDTVSSLIGEKVSNDSVIKRSQEVAGTVAYTLNDSLRLKGSAAYGFGIDTVDATLWNDAKYMQGVVGADYLLSKRTALNGQVGYLEFRQPVPNESSVKLKKGTVGVGLSHKF